MSLLEKMRSRSNIEKRIIAFNIALVITLVIFLIWLLSKFYTVDLGLDDTIQRASSPIDFIVSSTKSFFSGMTGK